MIEWPATLPDRPLLEGYTESAPAIMLRTEMDAGAAKQRKRYTAGVRPVSAPIMLRSKTQKETLDDFFEQTLEGGALAFMWKDGTGHARSFRFTGPPSFEAQTGEIWRANLPLEILP